MQNQVSILVRGIVKFIRARSMHNDIVLCFGADVVSIRGSQPVRLILFRRAEYNHPDRREMIQRQSGLLKEESAQLLQPHQGRSRARIAALRIHLKVFAARQSPPGRCRSLGTKNDRTQSRDPESKHNQILLISQRYDGIDLHCPAGGNIDGQGRGSHQR